MEKIERQLERIADKDRLRAVIDELGDDDRLLILRQYPGDEGYQFRCYGEMTLAEALYMVEAYRHWMFNGD